MREDLEKQTWKANDASSFHHPVDASKLVTWVESHDNYCNDHESGSISDEQIRLGWAFLVSRQYGTPLFYNRPDGSNSVEGNFWGNNLVGACGNDNYRHPAVVAGNHFRAKMQGQPESIAYDENGAVVAVSRGTKGAALINISKEAQTISIATTLPNGTYKDMVTGNKFKVKKGHITGVVAPLTACFLTK